MLSASHDARILMFLLQDPVSDGIRLNVCAHVFCEECIAEWLERDNTCPMCRAKVEDFVASSDGASSMLPTLF